MEKLNHEAIPKSGTQTIYVDEYGETFHAAICENCGRDISQYPGRGGEYDHD